MTKQRSVEQVLSTEQIENVFRGATIRKIGNALTDFMDNEPAAETVAKVVSDLRSFADALDSKSPRNTSQKTDE